MKTLGFTEKYYTLWNVSEMDKFYSNEYEYVTRTHFTYFQNLSMDYDKAIEKIEALTGGRYAIDLGLRGNGSFYKDYSKGNDYPCYMFDYGKLKGADIRTCTDVWQLDRARLQGTDSENTKYSRTELERRMFARKRMLEIGALLKINNQFILKSEHEAQLREEARKKAIELTNGHFFVEKSRVKLKVKQIKSFGFQTVYGFSFVRIYQTEDGKQVKYLGSSPPEVSEWNFTEIVATIAHSEYQGIAETKLQRIKVCL